MAGRKQIQDARVVVLRLDGVDAADAAQSLKDLGIVHAVGLADVGSLSVHIEGGKVDVLVVSSPPPTGITPPPVLPLPPEPPEAALKAGIPCLLLLPGTSRSARAWRSPPAMPRSCRSTPRRARSIAASAR